MQCASCGQEIKTKIKVPGLSFRGSTLKRNYQKVHLQPQEREILTALAAAYPNMARTAFLCRWLYPPWEDSVDSPERVITVYICRLRKIFEAHSKLRLRIVTHWGMGYRLVCDEEAEGMEPKYTRVFAPDGVATHPKQANRKLWGENIPRSHTIK